MIQDNCLIHNFSVDNVRNHLTTRFGQQGWIGRGAPHWQWPPRSPDLTPCDFGLWGVIKEIVYFEVVHTIDALRNRIIHAFNIVRNNPAMIRRMTQSAYDRALICYANNGDVFENFKN